MNKGRFRCATDLPGLLMTHIRPVNQLVSQTLYNHLEATLADFLCIVCDFLVFKRILLKKCCTHTYGYVLGSTTIIKTSIVWEQISHTIRLCCFYRYCMAVTMLLPSAPTQIKTGRIRMKESKQTRNCSILCLVNVLHLKLSPIHTYMYSIRCFRIYEQQTYSNFQITLWSHACCSLYRHI